MSAARLCDLLRAAGLRVGAQEELRVDLVLTRLCAEAAPQAGSETLLRDSLCAVVVKAPAERALFEQVFAAWAETMQRPGYVLDRGLPPPPPRPQGRLARLRAFLRRSIRRLSGKGRADRRRSWLGALALLLLLVGAVVVLRRPTQTPNGPAQPATPPPDAGAAVTGPTARVEDLAKPGDAGVIPRVFVLAPGGPSLSRAALALAVLALGGGLALFLLLRRRSYLPATVPWPAQGIPARALPRGEGAEAAPLLDRRDQDGLVYGVGHFVSAEPTRRLDVPASARATAAANGRPVLRFLRRREQREVFLWIDRAAAGLDPGQAALIDQLPAEIARALGRGGLPVEWAEFYGLPDLLETPRGPVAPAELDERREAAQVLVFTDGRILAVRLVDESERRRTAGLLRALAHWPHLWICDVSRGAYGLAARLSPFGIRVVAPEEAAAALSGEARRPVRAARAERGETAAEVRAFAAVLALAPFPVDEALAQAARRALVPAAGPWDLPAVRALAESAGGHLVFAGARRAALLRWLVLGDPGLLRAALRFWRGRVASTAAPAESWAALHRERDLALLDLWTSDAQSAVLAQAVRSLYALHGGPAQEGPLREEVRAALCALEPLDARPQDDHEQRAPVPFRLAALGPALRAMLQHMGLGGVTPRPGELRRPGRVALGWGLCAGAVLGAVVGIRQVPEAAPRIEERGTKPAGASVDRAPLGPRPAGTGVLRATVPWFRVTAQAGGQAASAEAAAGGAVAVEWLLPRGCRYEEQKDDKTGMVFVRVCAGTFLMGSGDDDAEAAGDEQPAHPVRVREFWIGQREVSNGEYRTLHPDHQSEEPSDWPATNVGWSEARAFCQALGGDLATEAQWEYAARGSDGRRYPWGNEPPDAERAVTNRKIDSGKDDHPDPVGSHPKGRGPFGTLDQAGNVWEWVVDCYDRDSYKARHENDNAVADKPACSRVMRGGSAWSVPWVLRAAFRNGNEPEGRNWFIGFRCVRSGRRQP